MKFIQLYDGNGTDTARKAGYTGSDNALGKTAYDLLRLPKILKAIAKRTDNVKDRNGQAKKIATREDRQNFWTETMTGKETDMKDRLKASELLGRSQADFTEKVQVSGQQDLNVIVDEARKKRGLKNED